MTAVARRNFVWALPPERLSAAAAVVSTALRVVAEEPIDSGAWSGVRRIAPAHSAAVSTERVASLA